MLLPIAIVRQYAIVLIVNFSVITTGMSLAWPSPVLVKLRNATESPLSQPITDEEGSWLVSLGFLCGIVLNLISGMLLDSIGRKYCILLASIPKVVIGLLFIFATDVWTLIIGRAILMVADGLVFATVPVYSSEIASKEHRGTIGTLLQIFSSFGILVTLSVGPFTSYTTFNTIFSVVIVVTTLPLMFLYDSPHYLYSKGRTDEAMKVLTLIRNTKALAEEEIEEYRRLKENQAEISVITMMRSKIFQKSLFLTIMLGAGGQIIGFNAVSFYLQTVLQSMHITVMPEVASVIMGVIQMVASFCAIPITSSFGRRTILMWSLSGYLMGMATLGVFFKITGSKVHAMDGFINYLPIMSLVVVIFSFSVGIGSLYWLIAAELFDGHSRAIGVSINLTIVTFLIFLTTKYFLFLISLLGPAGTYWFFSVMTVLFIAFIAIFLPETKGKTFSEIQMSLGAKIDNVKEIKC